MSCVYTAEVFAASGCVDSTGSEPHVDMSMLSMLQSPMLHLDVSPQGPDVHLDMSTLQSFCAAPGRVYSTGGLELHLEMS